MAKWATELGFDYTRIQISTNFGASWTNLAGRFTGTVGGQPSYHGVQSWIYERINLNAYIGLRVKFRFNYVTDAGVPGDGFYFDNFRVVNYTDSMIGITQNQGSIPKKYFLYQNYPNPFNPTTRIKFDIPRSSYVKLTIFDILGREVLPAINQNMEAGSYNYEFNASALPSGVYFYKLDAADFVITKKMLMLK